MLKIIQISACGHENNQNTQSNHTVYALCDDGSVWFQNNTMNAWVQLSDINYSNQPRFKN